MRARRIITAGLVAEMCFAAVLVAATPRLSFMRRIPAVRDPGGEHLVLIAAISDTNKVETFLDVFARRANQAGTLHVEDATAGGHILVGTPRDEAAIRKIRRRFPADLYLAVQALSCRTEKHEGEGSTKDVDGGRVKRRHVWADAVCEARLDGFDGTTFERRLSYSVRGEGTSPRVVLLTDEEREIAIEQAARYAAVAAAEEITPRLVRESIELDSRAPRFDEGMALIDASRVDAARDLWQQTLRQHGESAPLHYNLGAVLEATGDAIAARKAFEMARRLAPEESRYRHQFALFRLRNAALFAIDSVEKKKHAARKPRRNDLNRSEKAKQPQQSDVCSRGCASSPWPGL